MKTGIPNGQPNGLDLKIAALEERLTKLKKLAALRREIDQTSANIVDWKRYPMMEVVIDAISKNFGVRPEDVVGWSKMFHIMCARTAFYFLLRKSTGYSFADLGRSIGRNHSTILYGCQRASEMLTLDRAFAVKLAAAEAQIKKRVKLIARPAPNGGPSHD